MFKIAVVQSSRHLSRCSRSQGITTKRYAHAPAAFDWEDPLGSASLFTEEELSIQDTARSYCQERMLPRVLGRQLQAPNAFIRSFSTSQTPIETSTMTVKFSQRWGSWVF